MEEPKDNVIQMEAADVQPTQAAEPQVSNAEPTELKGTVAEHAGAQLILQLDAIEKRLTAIERKLEHHGIYGGA
jgi:hypothetical protein